MTFLWAGLFQYANMLYKEIDKKMPPCYLKRVRGWISILMALFTDIAKSRTKAAFFKMKTLTGYTLQRVFWRVGLSIMDVQKPTPFSSLLRSVLIPFVEITTSPICKWCVSSVVEYSTVTRTQVRESPVCGRPGMRVTRWLATACQNSRSWPKSIAQSAERARQSLFANVATRCVNVMGRVRKSLGARWSTKTNAKLLLRVALGFTSTWNTKGMAAKAIPHCVYKQLHYNL